MIDTYHLIKQTNPLFPQDLHVSLHTSTRHSIERIPSAPHPLFPQIQSPFTANHSKTVAIHWILRIPSHHFYSISLECHQQLTLWYYSCRFCRRDASADPCPESHESPCPECRAAKTATVRHVWNC